MTDFILGFNITVEKERQDLVDMVNDLLVTEKKNNINQELVTKFSSECDEYQNKLNNIDFRAMNIQNLINEIREMV